MLCDAPTQPLVSATSRVGVDFERSQDRFPNASGALRPFPSLSRRKINI